MFRLDRLQRLFDDVPLRPTVAVAVLLGLLLPLAVGAWRQVDVRRQALIDDLNSDHERIAQTLAIAMQTPIWEVRPDIGRPYVDALMADPRITTVSVSAAMLPRFLTASGPNREAPGAMTREVDVVRGGEVIGRVRVEMTTLAAEKELARFWSQILLTSTVQLLLGLTLLFLLLRWKVLMPVQRLVGQARSLASGPRDTAFRWERRDELGVLGRSLEQTRASLRQMFNDLGHQNTEIAARERTLAEQTRLLQIILDNMTDGISLIDRDLRLIAWNNRFIEMFDYPREMVHSGLPITELQRLELERRPFADEDQAAYLERMRASLTPGKAHAMLQLADDGRIIALRRRPLADGGFVTTYTDITAEERARHAAAQNLSLLEAVMDAVPAVLHVKDRDHRYQLVNRYFLDTWGFDRSQVIGRTLQDVFPPEWLIEFVDRTPDVVATGKPVPFYEIRVRVRDGSIRDLLGTKVPLLDGAGQVSHVVTVELDITERKQTERRLRESEELHRLLVDLSPYGIMLHDAGRIRFVNPAGCQVLGLSTPDLLHGRHYIDFVADGDKAEALQLLRRVIEDGETLTQAERRLITDDGRSIDASIAAVPFTRAGQRLALVMFRDISERKRTERERRRWLQLFRDAIESIPDGFAMLDAQGRLLACNAAFARFYGTNEDALAGTSAADLLPRFLEMVKSADGKTAAEAMPIWQAFYRPPFEQVFDPVQVELKDGRWMLINYHPTAEGGLVVVRTDISDIKQMQAALADSEELHRTVVNVSPCGIILHDPERIVFINPEGCRIFGEPDAQRIVGRSYGDFVADSDRQQAIARLQRVLDGELVVEKMERRFVGIDGRETVAAVAGVPLVLGGRRLALVIFLDITAIKAAEAEIDRQREALYQAEKMSALGSLLAGVAHELNNPLSVVVGRAIMLEDMSLEPHVSAGISKIRQAAERCARIVRTFLAMARQQAPSRVPVTIAALITASLELLGYSLKSAGVSVETDLDPNLPTTMADPDQIAQVFNNLIINAQQAMMEWPGPRQLTITTRCDAEKQRLAISFADTGPGVPPHLKPRIFDPFFTTKPAGIGTGIGLAVCRGVIESHGGSIMLDDRVGGGSVFTVVLPVVAAPSIADTAADLLLPSAAEPRLRILIVDDEVEVARLLEDILAADGHTIVIAGDGRQALAELGHRSFDAVISDLIMPELDGPGLYRAIRKRYPALAQRTIFVTGDTLSPSARRFLSRSRRPVLEKPFLPDDVRRVVRASTASPAA